MTDMYYLIIIKPVFNISRLELPNLCVILVSKVLVYVNMLKLEITVKCVFMSI